ncbi:MAG: YggT family protein [Armatimonadota bacterium]|nr:YggT family protein [Armatimonadota bacterium]
MDVVSLVNLVFQVLNILILIRIVLSWVPGVSLGHPAVRIVHQLTSPILDPIRRLMPPVGGLDLSPVVAILLLSLVRALLVQVLLAV